MPDLTGLSRWSPSPSEVCSTSPRWISRLISSSSSTLTVSETLYPWRRSCCHVTLCCVCLRTPLYSPCLHFSTFFLSGCKLSRVSHNFFSGVPRLQTLDLSSNNFTSLSRDSFAPLSNLTNLDLGNNPWPCSDASLDVLCFAASLRKEEKRSLRPVYCYDRGIRSKRLWSESLNTECKVQSSDGVTEDPDVTWQRPERHSGVSAEVYVASLMLVALILSFAVMCMMRYSGFCSPLRLFLYGTLRPEGET